MLIYDVVASENFLRLDPLELLRLILLLILDEFFLVVNSEHEVIQLENELSRQLFGASKLACFLPEDRFEIVFCEAVFEADLFSLLFFGKLPYKLGVLGVRGSRLLYQKDRGFLLSQFSAFL